MRSRSRSSVLEEISGYNELLNFAGSVENSKCPRVPKQTFHRRTSNDAKAAKNLHCLVNDVESSLGRVKFGYCRFARNASLGGIVLPSGTIDEECSSICANRHIGKFSLDQLVF
jgi:hypothetical protein